jgi:glycosyltransferase (activator-dependent family)
MRVLFTIFPATAHLYPIVPLAWALQAAGHQVCVASHAGEVEPDMFGTITAAGLTAVPLGDRSDLPALAAVNAGPADADRPTLALHHDGTDNWPMTRAYLLGMLGLYYPDAGPAADRRPMLDDLVDFAGAWQPDLVLWDPLCPPAPIAARAVGAAHARVLWGLDNIGYLRAQHLAHGGADPLVEWVRPMLDRHGQEYDEEVLTGQWSVDLVPPRMRLPLDGRTVPVRRVPYNAAAPLPAWLHRRPERPRVCLTLGVSSRKLFHRYRGFSIAGLFDLVSELDIELVATLNAAQLAEVSTVPPNVRTVDYLPLNHVLPTCAAVIHHGGGGTFAAAVAHRVPQLVIPVPKWDEAVTGRYVESRGAGVSLDSERFSMDDLGKQLARLLDEPAFRAGAADLHADSLALPTPTDIVPVLEKLTAEHRRQETRCAS